MQKRMNKKAQDLSIGTLILIVLGIIVLVPLILGFALGWENLWEKINIFGGSTSIGDVATACNLAITTQDKYSFCNDFAKIKVNNEAQYINCQDDRVKPSLSGELSCDGNPAQTKCEELINAKTDNADKKEICDNIKVNNVLCSIQAGTMCASIPDTD